MTDEVVVRYEPTPMVRVTTSAPQSISVGVCKQGPPGAASSGDMQALIYDPRGISDDAFDLSNLTGSIDGGVFT